MALPGAVENTNNNVSDAAFTSSSVLKSSSDKKLTTSYPQSYHYLLWDAGKILGGNVFKEQNAPSKHLKGRSGAVCMCVSHTFGT